MGLSSGFELGVTGGEDLFGSSLELIIRGEVADGAVPADGVVVADIIGHDPSGILQRQRRLGADALDLGAPVGYTNSSGRNPSDVRLLASKSLRRMRR